MTHRTDKVLDGLIVGGFVLVVVLIVMSLWGC